MNRCKKWIGNHTKEMPRQCNGELLTLGRPGNESTLCLKCGATADVDESQAARQSVAGV